LDIMDTPRERQFVLFHESGHVFRNILHSGRSHWDDDNVGFTYARCHTGFGIADEGYSFSEGWATYWQRARWTASPTVLVANSPLPSPPGASRTWTGDRCVVTDATMDPWAGGLFCPGGAADAAGTSVATYCSGGPATPLSPGHADWVEHMIADRILALADTGCAGATTDEADATMVRVLEENYGAIHYLHELERALCEAQLACCTYTRATPPPICPPLFTAFGSDCSGPGGELIRRHR
jgi:hypothetical protein